jgi:hypothetical protein
MAGPAGPGNRAYHPAPRNVIPVPSSRPDHARPRKKSKTMTHRLYIENGRARPEIYQIHARALGGGGRPPPGAAARIRGGDRPSTTSATMRRLAAADIAIGSKIDPARMKAHAKKLRWIHSTSAGVENMAPFDWLPAGATLTNSRGIHAPKAGEFGALAFLMLNDNMPTHFVNQRARRWGKVFATPIAGKTAVVLGLGNMGRAAAEKARSCSACASSACSAAPSPTRSPTRSSAPTSCATCCRRRISCWSLRR